MDQHAVAVVDLDNLLHRGLFKQSHTPRPQGVLDVKGLAAALKAAGVSGGAVCRNRAFPPFAQLLWESLGFKTISTGHNCDPEVMRELERQVDHPSVDRVVLVAGDGGYRTTLRNLKARQLLVEVWGRQKSTSKKLAEEADCVRWIDGFIGICDA